MTGGRKLPPGIRKRKRGYSAYFRGPDGQQVEEFVGGDLRAAKRYRRRRLRQVREGTWLPIGATIAGPPADLAPAAPGPTVRGLVQADPGPVSWHLLPPIEADDGRSRWGWVYAIASEGGPIKIGWSGGVLGRLGALQTAHPWRLHLVGTARGSTAAERLAHDLLAERRMLGEWFEAGPDTVRFVMALRHRPTAMDALADMGIVAAEPDL